MARITLIDPRGWKGPEGSHRPFINVGIAYLVPLLRKDGHEVSVIDPNNEELTDYQVLEAVQEFQPDLVGISVKTATAKSAKKLARKIKSLLPKVFIILGGPHTRFAYRELAAEPCIDVVFVGEGEKVLPIICHRLMRDGSIHDLPGVVTKHNMSDEIARNSPLIGSADLDNLPFPEYDLFPEAARESLGSIGYPLLTSRGCVYSCTYCSVPEISGKKWRKRSPQNVIEELKYAKEKYAIKAFEIIDDVFNLDIRRSKEICSSLIRADLGLKWSCPNGLRADRVDPELAELMYKAGCHTVCVGVESADPSVFSKVQKGESLEDIERGIRIFNEVGIDVVGFFIIGLPGDSLTAQECSVDFAKRVGIRSHYCMLIPYQGTALWEWARTNARFLQEPEEGVHFAENPDQIKIVIETDDFPAAERYRAYEMVYTRLGQFYNLIPSDVPRWKHHLHKLRLLWRHDRAKLVPCMARDILGQLRSMLDGLMRLTLRKIR
jgi:radical SAM superfamily enzyme YgiQ (UPF0313 family)